MGDLSSTLAEAHISTALNNGIFRGYNGEFKGTFDSKRRIAIPLKFRKCMEKRNRRKGYNRIYAVKSLRNGLHYLACLDDLLFNRILAKQRKTNVLHLNGRDSWDGNWDAAGRIILPEEFLQYAGIRKDAVFVAEPRFTHFELWQPENFGKGYVCDCVDLSLVAEECLRTAPNKEATRYRIC